MKPSTLLALLACFACSAQIVAQTPNRIYYQGCLTDLDGTPLPDGNHDIVIGLFTQVVGGTPSWIEPQTVSTKDCVFDTWLGATFPLNIAFNQEYYLGIGVDGVELPRSYLGAVPYALALLGMRPELKSASIYESINLLGGHRLNYIDENVTGATISGGGGYASGELRTNLIMNHFGTIGGGSGNRTDGIFATVAGGGSNNAYAAYATIGGGTDNAIDGMFGVVGGGFSNVANNHSATIGGGGDNYVTGLAATVPGGSANWAQGDYSFAAGRQAHVQSDHPGSFVWADHTEARFASTSPDQFLIRAASGVGINTDQTAAALNITQKADTHRGGIRLSMASFPAVWEIVAADEQNLGFAFQETFKGWILAENGSYNAVSDRRMKKDINDLEDVLERLMQLRPTTYRYVDQPADAAPSMGFIAQEVESLFPDVVSENDGVKGISYAQFAVLAIKAIQELKAELESLKLALGHEDHAPAR